MRGIGQLVLGKWHPKTGAFSPEDLGFDQIDVPVIGYDLLPTYAELADFPV